MGWIKGEPVRMFPQPRQLAGLSDQAADVREHNAVSVAVEVTGDNPSATVSVETASEQGGNYMPVIDPNGSQTAVSTNKIFDVIVGCAWVKVRLVDVLGTFVGQQGYTVWVTPWVAPGPSSIVATVS